MRSDTRWRRELDDDGAGRPGLDAAQLVSAALWVNSRAGERRMGRRDWTVTDEQTMTELEARSWCYGELQALALWSTPSWFTLLDLPRRCAGFERFLGFLVRAYRVGAVGCLLSYEECMSLCDVKSRATWAKWTRELEVRGLIRIVQTWRVDERGRVVFDRLHYRIGPALENLGGVALCERPDDAPGATWASRVAAGLRRRAREARRTTKARRWKQCREGLHVGDAVQDDVAGGARQDVTLEPQSQSVTASSVVHSDARSSARQDVEDLASSTPPPSLVHGVDSVTTPGPLKLRKGGELDGGRSSSSTVAPQTAVAVDELGVRAGVAEGAQPAAQPTTPRARHQPGPPRPVGSSQTALHSAPVPGADTRSPRRAREEASPAGCAPSATPARTPSSSTATAVCGATVLELERPPSSSSSSERVRALQASDELAQPRRGATESDTMQRDETHGVDLLRQWLDEHASDDARARGCARRDALDELRRSLDAATPPRCSTCGGAGGRYGKSRDVVDGPAWAPERRVAFDEWCVCDDCDGSGEGP